MTRVRVLAGVLFLICSWPLWAAEEPADTPKPVPATRPELKDALEALKNRQRRIPLPTPDSGDGNALYLPETWGGGGGLGGFRQFNNFGTPGRGGQNPQYQLDHLLTNECFWVVSRGNNCHYCLGHQELKLRAEGLDDDAIAALDTNWNRFDPRKQLALAFARKLTLEPDEIGDEDIANLKELFSDAAIIELAFTIGVFNSMNRWTDGMGFPQERHVASDGEVKFTTPTSEPYRGAESVVAPTNRDPRRPPLPATKAYAAMRAARDRTARVALPPVDKARQELKDVLGGRPPFQWERALVQLPLIGKMHVLTWNTILADDHLTPRLKAELALISAVHNRAWYAAGHAVHRLNELGVSSREMDKLLTTTATSGESPAQRLAAKLTAAPHLIADSDIQEVRAQFSDAEAAQILHVICLANLFDRFTEALGLSLEDEIGPGNAETP